MQLSRTIVYLNSLPVNMLALDNVEADDTIAYCAFDKFKDSSNVYIMSADKDFLQLSNAAIKIWSPTKKKLYGTQEVINEYGIHPNNFVLYRSLDGDASDNIPGIKGFGLKTTLKAFPFLVEEKEVQPEELYNYATNNITKLKVYETLLNNKDIFERNIQLMQLKDTQLQTFAQLHVNDCLNKPLEKLNRFEFGKLITEDCMSSNIPSYFTWLEETYGTLLV
jgi:DNA polymerase I